MGFGDLVTIPKAPEKGTCVVINVQESLRGTVVLLRTKYNTTFFTKSSNCEKVQRNEL